MAGIRRCHFPLAGAADIMVAAGMAAGTAVAGMAEVGMAEVGMAVDMAAAGMAAGTTEIICQRSFPQRPKVRAKSGLGIINKLDDTGSVDRR
jgi:hypothetical protein